VVEICAVVDGSLFGGRAAKDFGSPGVEVGIKVDDTDGAVGLGDGTEEWQRYGVVPAQRDNAWEGLAILRRANLLCISHGLAHQELIVAFFDLLDGVGIVVAIDTSTILVDHIKTF